MATGRVRTLVKCTYHEQISGKMLLVIGHIQFQNFVRLRSVAIFMAKRWKCAISLISLVFTNIKGNKCKLFSKPVHCSRYVHREGVGRNESLTCVLFHIPQEDELFHCPFCQHTEENVDRKLIILFITVSFPAMIK